ncbi:hypothetical protein QR680_004239 [Steinernema hermaphroditum]|uniref:Prolyl 4-hydroxylase alpha subunit domain-containing protein n=1 Tax=Steinernema hermaphroditum TaxID=289476 RepID=A0AA39HN27_9BILA|nr:hypothetical protein QR680_004239 [Steinernema hermaphroditum]
MKVLFIFCIFASFICSISAKHIKKPAIISSETTNLHRLQDAVGLLNSSISGYSTKYPSGQRFLDFAATVNAIETFENTSEINREIPKLGIYMEKLDALMRANMQLPALSDDRYDYGRITDADSVLTLNFLQSMTNPRKLDKRSIERLCFRHPPVVTASTLWNFIVGSKYVDRALNASHYSLAHYTKLKAFVHLIGFKLMLHEGLCNEFIGRRPAIGDHDEIEKQMIESEQFLEGKRRDQKAMQKILSSYEFENITKTSAAQKLKNHLDETFGRSHWPEEDVHRFGVLIFNDTFFHPTVNSDDQNAFLLPWKKEKSIILVYKSTFGSEQNGTYLSNQKFFEENIATINNTLGSVLRGGCYFGPHFDAIVPRDLKWVTTNLKKSHDGLFYFWLTTDEKVTVPRDSWLKFLFKTMEVDRKWTEADIGWAVGTSEESRAAAVIKTVIPGITCFLMEKGVFPLLIMVGF